MQTSTASTGALEGPARIRMSGVKRRQHFIDAAVHLFSSNGFRGTSTRAIAEAAGVSEALLFRHFPTKADLYAAILQQKARESGLATRLETLRRLAQRIDDWVLVQYLVRAILASYRRAPEFERLMLYAALEGHELATTSGQLFGVPAFALLRDYMVRRQQAGAFRPGDPASLVFGLVALPAYYSMARRLLGARGRTRPRGLPPICLRASCWTVFVCTQTIWVPTPQTAVAKPSIRDRASSAIRFRDIGAENQAGR